MSRHDKHLTKKERKKAQIKFNRRIQEIFWALGLMRGESERVREKDEGRRKSGPDSFAGEDEAIWSEKVATIRNRLTDKKRTSKERWNRFSGTGGEGGRGL